MLASDTENTMEIKNTRHHCAEISRNVEHLVYGYEVETEMGR